VQRYSRSGWLANLGYLGSFSHSFIPSFLSFV
jgi:hypothetical protein